MLLDILKKNSALQCKRRQEEKRPVFLCWGVA